MNGQRIDFNKNRTTGEIFSDYWGFLKSEWQQYCVMLGVFVLPFALAAAYLMTKHADSLFLEDIESLRFSDLYGAMALSFVSKFFGIFISCAYVITYIEGRRIDMDSMKSFFSENFIPAFLAVLFMMGVLFVGFCFFIIPGIILLPPLSLITFDVLFMRQNCLTSFSRCVNLCKTNVMQSFLVVMICYTAIFVLPNIIGSLLPADNDMLNIMVSALLTVVSETTMVPFILLYYSLANQNMNV